MISTPRSVPVSAPIFPFSASVFSASSTRSNDLGFSRWETIEFCERSSFFDVYFARSRRADVRKSGEETSCAFILKALKPRYCGSILGAALIEREIFLGSLSCPRISPVVDFVRPRRLSADRSRRGCVVFPYFPGRTLAERLAAGETFAPATVSAVERQLRTAVFAMNRRGWSIGDLTPNRVLLSDAPTPNAEPLATVIDFSSARRFVSPSLFVNAPLDGETPDAPTFDPRFELPPDVFFDPNSSAEKDVESLLCFTRRLRSTDVANRFDVLKFRAA